MKKSNETPAAMAPERYANRAVDRLAQTMEPTRILAYRHYGNTTLQFHIFEPDNTDPNKPRSCFLVLHGGGWRTGTPRVFFPLADYFSRRGMVAISMEYRFAGNNPPLDCVRDGRSAVRYLRAHAAELGIDPKRIVVGGGSAGAHVAAGTALFDGMDAEDDDTAISTIPDAMVLCYPVIDTSAEGYGHDRCGTHWQELSPLHRVRPGMPPTLVFHGTGDKVCPFIGAQRFHEAMQKAGNHCELVVYENGVHGYFLDDLILFEQVLAKTDDFLASLHFLEPRPAKKEKT